MRRMATCVFTLLYLVCAATITSRVSQDQNEDPWKKFERKGGRLEKAELVNLQDGELSSPGITGARDLKVYDQGGYLNCFNHIPVSTRKKEVEIERRAATHVAAARQFIWKHWQEHRRAYIRLSFDSVDTHSTSHIFIEPGVGEQWQVVWRIVHSRKEITTLPILRSVAWDYSENEHGELVFKDGDGDVWRRL